MSNAFDEDPRLQALDAAWFEGRNVLDVGCNEGLLTLSLTCKFACKSMLGVDIDRGLVAKAARSLCSLRGQLIKQLTSPCLGSGCASADHLHNAELGGACCACSKVWDHAHATVQRTRAADVEWLHI
jgi:hypothetical protein